MIFRLIFMNVASGTGRNCEQPRARGAGGVSAPNGVVRVIARENSRAVKGPVQHRAPVYRGGQLLVALLLPDVHHHPGGVRQTGAADRRHR